MGILFASVKGLILAWLLLVALQAAFVQADGPIVAWVNGLSPTVAAVVETATPPEVATMVLPVLR